MTSVNEGGAASGHRILTLMDKDGKIRLSVAPDFGGEIVSLSRLWHGRWIELLYRADRSKPPRPGWRGGAPWLFPAVGRNFAKSMGSWQFEGRDYSMPIHGFVMAQPWTASASSGSIVCATRSNADTRSKYPFEYELRVEYSLRPSGLRAEVEVAAGRENSRPMPFSVGNHISLAIPFADSGDAGSCIVRTPARVERLMSRESLLTGNTRPVDYRRGTALRDAPNLSDCVLGEYPPGEKWVEITDPASFGVRIRQREIVDSGAAPKTSPEHFCFVFYSDSDRNFICPEPWYGGPNSLNEGRGIVRLNPGERFDWEMTVEFA